MHAERPTQFSTLAQRLRFPAGNSSCLRVLLPIPISDCPVALALCSLSCSVPLSRGASALNRFICVTWRNLINCYLSLFPSLVIFCWRCKPPLTGGGMRDMHSRSVLPRFRHTRYRSRYKFRQRARVGFAGVSSTVGVANLRLGDRIRGVENTNPLFHFSLASRGRLCWLGRALC